MNTMTDSNADMLSIAGLVKETGLDYDVVVKRLDGARITPSIRIDGKPFYSSEIIDRLTAAVTDGGTELLPGEREYLARQRAFIARMFAIARERSGHDFTRDELPGVAPSWLSGQAPNTWLSQVRRELVALRLRLRQAENDRESAAEALRKLSGNPEAHNHDREVANLRKRWLEASAVVQEALPTIARLEREAASAMTIEDVWFSPWLQKLVGGLRGLAEMINAARQARQWPPSVPQATLEQAQFLLTLAVGAETIVRELKGEA